MPYFFRKSEKMSKNLSAAAVVIGALRVNSFLASGDFCRLLITYAIGLDPDHGQHNGGPDLHPNCYTL